MSNFKIGSVYKFTKEFLEVRSEIYHMAACPGDLQPMSWKQVASRSCVFLCTRLDEEKNVATLLTQSIQGEIFELAQYMLFIGTDDAGNPCQFLLSLSLLEYGAKELE